MSCDVGPQTWLGFDVSTALNGPLAWEPPYAVGVTLKKKKRALGFFGVKNVSFELFTLMR